MSLFLAGWLVFEPLGRVSDGRDTESWICCRHARYCHFPVLSLRLTSPLFFFFLIVTSAPCLLTSTPSSTSILLKTLQLKNQWRARHLIRSVGRAAVCEQVRCSSRCACGNEIREPAGVTRRTWGSEQGNFQDTLTCKTSHIFSTSQWITRNRIFFLFVWGFF